MESAKEGDLVPGSSVGEVIQSKHPCFQPGYFRKNQKEKRKRKKKQIKENKERQKAGKGEKGQRRKRERKTKEECLKGKTNKEGLCGCSLEFC